MILTSKNSTDWISLIKKSEKIDDESDYMLPINKEYLESIKNNDVDKVKNIINNLAKMSGYNVGPVWHGTDSNRFNQFKKISYFIDDKSESENYGNNTYSYYLQTATNIGITHKDLATNRYKVEKIVLNFGKVVKIPQDLTFADINIYSEAKFNVYLVPFSFQIKLVDIITYDDVGNIIPISKRFDSSNSDIRF